MVKKQAHVAPSKKDAVKKITELINGYPIVGVARVTGIPGPQLQKIRQKLRGKAEILVSKNNLFLIAIEEAERSKPGLKSLAGTISSQTALVATKLNPFSLFKEMEATKQASPARGGETAPEDIMVHEGETSFKPGPIVGELQKAGIPAGIEAGKVMIKKDKVLVKKGERIPRELAPILVKLEIFPLTVGLDLQAAYETGTVYPAKVLAVDDARIMADMGLAANQAFNLAMFSAYPSLMTMVPLLQKARLEALALVLEAAIPEKDAIEPLLARAYHQARALQERTKAS
jgi:large subunit ribosomal protein L10